MVLASEPRVWSTLRDLVEWSHASVFPAVEEVARTPGGRWLDVGCGDGRFARFFAPGAYLGVDVRPERVRVAALRNPRHRFAIGSAGRTLPGGCNGALLVLVLHHLDDDEVAALGEGLRRALEPPSRVLVVDPWPPWHPGMPGLHSFLASVETGRWHRTPERVRDLLGLDAAPVEATGPALWRGYRFVTTVRRDR